MRKIGIDGNAPLDGAGNIGPTIQPDLVAATGTGYVRVNFVLGPYDSPRNPAWQSKFDSLIDGLRARGVQIYGLIGHESVRTPLSDRCRDGAPNGAADEWIREYVDNFDAIVERFQGRVEFFESFNEPNDWKGQQHAWVHPYWMAKMLREIYQRVKIQNKRQVTLVSGPILTHDGDTGEGYIDGFLTAGKNQHGWNEFRAQHGTFPLDGLGFHIYIEREPDPAGTARAYKKRVDQIWNLFTRHEGANTPKRLFISEFGWQAAHGEDHKARHIETALPLLRNDWRVRLAILFCMQGWGSLTWGIYRPTGLGPGDREPAYAVFRAQAAQDKAQPGTTTRPGTAGQPPEPLPQQKWWQPMLDRYFASNAQMKSFLGGGVPGGFLAQDGNRIEFFQNGGLIVRPNGEVTMAPIGAWIGEEYRRKSVPEFQWANDRGGDNRYFEDTLHNLFGDFKAAWKGMYGKPVSEEFYLVLNGKAATCQMFEFAMMMHNPNTNQFELVQGRLSEIFLSVLEGGKGLETIGPLVKRSATRSISAAAPAAEVAPRPEGAPVAIPRMGAVPEEEIAAAAVPLAPELPAERITLRSRADVLALLELTANALLRGEIDGDTADALNAICITALEAL